MTQNCGTHITSGRREQGAGIESADLLNMECCIPVAIPVYDAVLYRVSRSASEGQMSFISLGWAHLRMLMEVSGKPARPSSKNSSVTPKVVWIRSSHLDNHIRVCAGVERSSHLGQQGEIGVGIGMNSLLYAFMALQAWWLLHGAVSGAA